jgi:hypothetical protein
MSQSPLWLLLTFWRLHIGINGYVPLAKVIGTIDQNFNNTNISNMHTTVFRVKRLNNRTCWLLHGSLKVIKLQLRFKVCSISYLHVLFHSSYLLLTFRYIHHKKIKGKEYIHILLVYIVKQLKYKNIYYSWDLLNVL